MFTFAIPQSDPDGPVDQEDVHLDGRIAARVEDLAADDVLDQAGHASSCGKVISASAGSSAATPGRVLPSMNSSDAPPPVLTWVIFSVRPKPSTAATESPPPTMVTAPALVRLATTRAIWLVPSANCAISKTPIGPFQKMVLALARWSA